jgi:hypothetical protein
MLIPGRPHWKENGMTLSTDSMLERNGPARIEKGAYAGYAEGALKGSAERALVEGVYVKWVVGRVARDVDRSSLPLQCLCEILRRRDERILKRCRLSTVPQFLQHQPI